MAGDGKARSNKQMTISFTLPISCQICLGKVRQPVLCPNHHVFCNLCLDIWLKRHNHCPACRVDIGPDNPIRHIIGSQLEEEDSQAKSTPEFRRARFDLLYKEYEDELEQLQKENTILKFQNNILTTQLKDAEHKNTITEEGKKASGSHPPPQTSEGPKLLLLTRNLQEAQKLYQGIKAEMSELKQENCRLKDESVNLTRENENLRLEIAQRSPKKFGRYTVATLEAKIAEQEKGIRQLKKALERSDAYIEELQQPQDRRGGYRYETETTGGKPRFQINLEPKMSTAEDSGATNGGGHRKVLFGKVVHEETVKPSSKVNVFSTLGTGKSLQKLHSGQIFSKNHEYTVGGDFDSIHLQEQADLRNKPATSGHSEGARQQLLDLDESVHVSSQESLQPQSDPKETNSRVIPEKTAKKVHFKDSGKPSDASSFSLELPSPMSSLVNESYSSFNKDLSSPGQKSSPESELSPGYECQVKMEDLPNDREDDYSRSSLNKHIPSSGASQTVSKSDITRKKKLKARSVAKKVKHELVEENMEDSSHLSLPDVTPPESADQLSQVTDYTDTSDDCDMSLTPEMTDCLRLISQAEKKLSSMASIPSVVVQKANPMIDPVHQMAPDPSDDSLFQKPSAVAGGFLATSSDGGHRLAAASSSWQQQFYNSVKVNPRNVSSIYKPPSVAIGSSHNPLTSDHFASRIKNKMYSLMDYNPSKDAASGDAFTFSEPITVTFPSADLQDSAEGRKLSTLASPFSLYLSELGTSASSSTYPSSSSFNFTQPSVLKDSYYHSSSSIPSAAPSAVSHTNTHV